MNHLEEINNLKARIDQTLEPKKKRKLQSKRTQLIRVYLEKNDNQFRELVRRQFELLKATLMLKATQSRNAMFGSKATTYKGEIHDNGYAYFSEGSHDSYTVSSTFGPRCPSGFEGRIDYLGKVTIEATSFEFRFIRGLPEEYEGRINSQGQISIPKVRYSNDLTQGNVTKMVGCIISDSAALSEFRTNRIKLKQMIEEMTNKLNDSKLNPR